MSYTLRGRLESRIAAAIVPLLAGCVLALAVGGWWPLELAALMLAAGLGLDALLYHRFLAYQAGWAAVPLGLLELAVTMTLARVIGVQAPLVPAVAFFAAAWLIAQILGHAGFPLLALSYGDDGGELGRLGPAATAAAAIVLAAAGGVAWALQPPTVHLEAGVHRGPLVLDRAQTLVGERGAVVRGGIVITADDVTVRGVTVYGGENGFEIDDAENVVLEDVTVAGAELDGIHVRRSQVTVRDCLVDSLGIDYAQGIDISFGFDLAPSLIEGCTVIGGREGIVTHFTRALVRDNRVVKTTLRGITMTEMSMGAVEGNRVADALGVGIFCGDYSECEITGNEVSRTAADPEGDGSRQGYAIVAHYGAKASVDDNAFVGNHRHVGAFAGARLSER